MLDYLMDFHALCAISLFSMENLVFLLVEKENVGKSKKVFQSARKIGF